MPRVSIPKGLVRKYPGKRVAIVEGKVVTASTSAKTSYERAKRKYPQKEVLIYHVPAAGEKYHLYSVCVCLTKMASPK